MDNKQLTFKYFSFTTISLVCLLFFFFNPRDAFPQGSFPANPMIRGGLLPKPHVNTGQLFAENREFPTKQVAANGTILFSGSREKGNIDLADSSFINRVRFVKVNFDNLYDEGIHAKCKTGEYTLGLNLFKDVNLTFIVEDIKPTPPLGFTWEGRVKGLSPSSARIVLENGVLTAQVTVPGKNRYQVQYAGNGVHAVYEFQKNINTPENNSYSIQDRDLKVKVAIENVEVQLMESLPAQINIMVTGNLPDGCKYELISNEIRDGYRVNVQLEGKRKADLICNTSIQPVNHSLRLGSGFPTSQRGFAPGNYKLFVNGHETAFSVKAND